MVQLKLHLVIAFLDHPVLGAVQNSTIGSSPDPLSVREGLAGETTNFTLCMSSMVQSKFHPDSQPFCYTIHFNNYEV